MALSNYAVSERFINGGTSGKSCNMRIEDDYFYSYATVIAMRLDDGRIAVNNKKYSVSTSRQQSELRNALYHGGYQPTQEYVEPPYSRSYYYPSNEPFQVWERVS